MPGFREEVKELDCGCKIGRSKQGLWFYDYLCEIHVAMVYDENEHYSLKLAEELTKKLNEQMKKKKEENPALKELSITERKAYNYIRQATQPLAIRDMPHQLQGPIGKLRNKDLIEVYRSPAQVSKYGYSSVKMTNCVRVKESS